MELHKPGAYKGGHGMPVVNHVVSPHNAVLWFNVKQSASSVVLCPAPLSLWIAFCTSCPLTQCTPSTPTERLNQCNSGWIMLKLLLNVGPPGESSIWTPSFFVRQGQAGCWSYYLTWNTRFQKKGQSICTAICLTKLLVQIYLKIHHCYNIMDVHIISPFKKAWHASPLI